jgi:hypothetical protein
MDGFPSSTLVSSTSLRGLQEAWGSYSSIGMSVNITSNFPKLTNLLSYYGESIPVQNFTTDSMR